MTDAKRILVTGGSRGIGRALVLAALDAGADVAFTYVQNETAAYEVVAEAARRAPGRRCLPYRLDLKEPGDVEATLGCVIEDLSSLDAVVCSAGITRNNLLLSMSNEDWSDVLATNLSGAFYVAREVLPVFLAEGGGRFVFISSIAKDGMAGQASHCASKAGLIGLSGSIAKEYGRKGVTSNVVVPGFFGTDMTRDSMSDALKEFWVQHCPLKRMGRLEELASVALFLMSPAASFVNGQVISVTGGLDWAG